MQPEVNLSNVSLERLENVHPDLSALVREVSRGFPCLVVAGYRGEEEQRKAFLAGASKLDWPHSMHNKSPSLAVDLSPLPYNPDDTQALLYFAGFVMGVASKLGLEVRWGGDWAGRLDPAKNRFADLFHFELQETPHNNS